MKAIILLSILFYTSLLLSQDKMSTKKGEIIFEASVPSFEEVTSKNNDVSCILDTKTGEIYCLALIKNFHFKLALMQEHFNTNYMESSDYPKATFKGIIQGFNINIIGTNPKEFKLKGNLIIHGKTKQIKTNAILRKRDEGLEIISEFIVNTEDFDIEVPSIVSIKIAKAVTIKTEFLVK